MTDDSFHGHVLNPYLSALILGVVEGLTEFLPVSSTAHIRLVQDWLGIDLENGYWKMFSVVIQLGAILSVVLYFWKRLVDFVKTYPDGVIHEPPAVAPEQVVSSDDRAAHTANPQAGEDARVIGSPVVSSPNPLAGSQTGQTISYASVPARRTWWNHPLSLVFIAFVVTAGPAYLIDKKIGENLEKPALIAWALIIGGIAMWVIDVIFSKRARTDAIEKMTLTQSVVIGAAQLLAAAFPGTSRSMSTIAAGQVLGLTRTAALEFSFFLSIPVMCAATAFKLLQFIRKEPVAMTGQQWGVLAVGFVVSFIVALACVHFFMGWVRNRGFVPFAIYRIVLGIIVLALAVR